MAKSNKTKTKRDASRKTDKYSFTVNDIQKNDDEDITAVTVTWVLEDADGNKYYSTYPDIQLNPPGKKKKKIKDVKVADIKRWAVAQLKLQLGDTGRLKPETVIKKRMKEQFAEKRARKTIISGGPIA